MPYLMKTILASYTISSAAFTIVINLSAHVILRWMCFHYQTYENRYAYLVLLTTVP